MNKALKKGIESGTLKFAASDGRKGAGSYKLGENAKKKPAATKKKTQKKVGLSENINKYHTYWILNQHYSALGEVFEK